MVRPVRHFRDVLDAGATRHKTADREVNCQTRSETGNPGNQHGMGITTGQWKRESAAVDIVPYS